MVRMIAHVEKKGKYFKVFDRLEKSELRGCSDVISK